MERPAHYALDDRYLSDVGTVFLTGIQALARLPLEQLRVDRRAGLNTAAFISGYPGSPLGGYDGAVAAAAALVPELPIVCRPAMNEEYGASAVMGSQLAAAQPDCRYDGVLGLWYGKAPGVDRAADALRHAVFAGTSRYGGAVAIVGDDPAAKSSTVPSSSAGVLSDMHVPLLYPGDPAEALDLGRHAIALSRLTGLWTALKVVADVADATASVELDLGRVSPVLPMVDGREYEHQPSGNLLTPRTLDVEREIYEIRYQLAREYASANRLNRVTVDPPDAWVGIVSSGITYREVREAFARLGLRDDDEIRGCGIRLLKMGMPMPFNQETVRQFSRGLNEVFVIEEKRPNIESLIKDALYDLSSRPRVVGKLDEQGRRLVPGHGALDANILVPILRERFSQRLGDRLKPPPPGEGQRIVPLDVARTPFYCSGCPHNRSTEAPEGSLVGAGIGCHTMALLMDEDRVGHIGGLGCMGNEGIQWIGMSEFLERDHFFQNLGDGTYFHSGQLAIQASIAAGVNVTYKLLYNGTIAMTGGQDPQTQLPVPVVARNLLNQGVARVLITTDAPGKYSKFDLPPRVEVWSRERLIEAQELLSKIPGTTVLIHDQGCAAEARRARRRGRLPKPIDRVVINHRICEGCGHCGEISNCLSVQPVETIFGRKTQIDQTTCNFDYSCLEGDCPSFMVVTKAAPTLWSPNSIKVGSGDDRSPQRNIPLAPTDIASPIRIVSDDEFSVRITGIGGTGVVTVAQVVGTAAMLDGYQVRGLDQIGLSQKAGPVVSDLRLSRSRPTSTNRLGEAQADLLLAFDQLVAASELGLRTAAPDKTTVVGSTASTPTGEMITHLEIKLPSPETLIKRIADRSRSHAHFWADATAITRDLFGNSTSANIFVVGMAVQAGCLPISPDRIEEAIDLNGVAVEANKQAFRWGRWQISKPERVEAMRQQTRMNFVPEVPASENSLTARHGERIESLKLNPGDSVSVETFSNELVLWGNVSDLDRYLDVLERVAQTEDRVRPESRLLTMAVATHLFKLMAYKDEYEVARLMLDSEATASARSSAGERVAWKLHPPILRALGLNRKITIGSWATPAVRLLSKAKVLRGTLLDPFGYAEVRRLERVLPGEYVDAIDVAISRLREENFEDLVGLSELPDLVRGYEEIKLGRIVTYRAQLERTLSEIMESRSVGADASVHSQ